MRVSRVRFENFCPFRELEFDLSPGLNMVVGPNGSGKSSVLSGIYGAVTNDFSRIPGKKEENVSQLAPAQEPSSIRLWFNHNGADYRLTRHLRPTKQELVIPGTDPITRDALVNQRVAQILGVTPEILDKYIFVDQWAMFDFLTATDTDRAKAFQKLFGTLEAEKAWVAVGEVLSRTEVPQIQADLDGQQRMLEMHGARIAELRALLTPYASLPESPSPDDDDAQIVKDANRRIQIESERRSMGQRLGEWYTELADARIEQSAFIVDRDNLAAAQRGGKEALDAAKAALANWKTLKTVQTARARVEAQLEKARQEEPLHPKPNRNGLYVSDLDQAFHDRMSVLDGEIARAERFIASLDPSTGCVECPTCFTPVESLLPTLEDAKAALPKLKAEQAEHKRRRDYSIEVDRQESAYLAWHTGWKSRMESLEKQLAELKTIDRPERDETSLQHVVAEADELERAIQDVERELDVINKEVANLEGKIAVEEQRLDLAMAELDALRLVSPDDLADVEARIARRAVAFQERARLRGELESEERHHAAFAESIRTLQSKQAEAERTKRWVRHLNEIRGVLHRDNLPRVVAEHFLQELQGDTNAALGAFESPFRIEVGDKLSFRAVFHDGRVQPAGRLSGGQKVVLAIAFRISVNSMFAQDVGLLCLDEPTVGLDEHNLGCLETAISRLRELSRSRGLQVILVTHERSIGHLFDKVIDLSVTS